ncbi:hypothetical protein LIA77_07343 [Sarocladium implicatum]|nr:hypothetical protein LIA77_07343 [Sarocladium implicatum]
MPDYRSLSMKELYYTADRGEVLPLASGSTRKPGSDALFFALRRMNIACAWAMERSGCLELLLITTGKAKESKEKQGQLPPEPGKCPHTTGFTRAVKNRLGIST